MRTSETVTTYLLAGLRITLLTYLCAGAASASDLVSSTGGKTESAEEKSEGMIESVVEATKSAVREYLAGNKESAVATLEVAAK